MKKPTPLQVLLAVMHRKWAAGDLDGAASLARSAAAFVHPRAKAKPIRRRMAQRDTIDLGQLTDAELDAFRDGEGAAVEVAG